MLTPDETAALAAMQLGIGPDEITRWAVVIECPDGSIRATASDGATAEAAQLLTLGITAMYEGEPWAG